MEEKVPLAPEELAVWEALFNGGDNESARVQQLLPLPQHAPLPPLRMNRILAR